MIEWATEVLKSNQETVLTFELATQLHEVIDRLPYNQPLKPLLGFCREPAPAEWSQFVNGLKISQKSKITLAVAHIIRRGEYCGLDELHADLRTSSFTKMERIPPLSRTFLIVAFWPDDISV